MWDDDRLQAPFTAQPEEDEQQLHVLAMAAEQGRPRAPLATRKEGF
jgi:hypothetical protein